MIPRLVKMGSRNLRRNLHRTVITVAGLGLGLALASAAWVLIDGYLQGTIDAMVGGSTGHLQIVHPGQLQTPNLFDVVKDPDTVASQLMKVPGVLAATPRVNSAVLLSAGERSSGAMLEGLSPTTEGTVSRRPQQVVDGRFVQGPKEVVLGKQLAQSLRLEVGDEVLAVSQAADGSLANALWTVVGLADTRSDVTNQTVAWTTLREAQDFLALDGAHVVIGVVSDANGVGTIVHEIAGLPGYTGVVSEFADPNTIAAMSASAPDEIEPNVRVMDPDAALVVRSWRAINPFMADMFDMGRSWTLVSVALVLITAGLGAANTMSMSVAERTRELGILIAVGMRPAHMVALVLFESLALFVYAMIFGLAVGAGLCAWLVEVGLDYSATQGDIVFEGVAMAPVIRGSWSADAFWIPVVMLLCVTVVASAVPAVRAARLNPVDALRR